LYITAEQLLLRLPDEGGNLAEEEVQGHIDFWISELARVNGGEPPAQDTPLTRRIVRDGAYADALEELLERDGIYQDAAVDSRRERAAANLQNFDAILRSAEAEERESRAEYHPVSFGQAPFYPISPRLPEEYQR
jgi:hypothetical protein